MTAFFKDLLFLCWHLCIILICSFASLGISSFGIGLYGVRKLESDYIYKLVCILLASGALLFALCIGLFVIAQIGQLIVILNTHCLF